MEKQGTPEGVFGTTGKGLDAVFRKWEGMVFWGIGLLMPRKFCVTQPGYIV